MAVLHQAFNRHPAVFVMLQYIGHDGIGDLVADLIRVPVRYLFAGNDSAHFYLPKEKPRSFLQGIIHFLTLPPYQKLQ